MFDGQLCVTERMLYGGLPNDEIITFADDLAAEAGDSAPPAAMRSR